MNVLFVLSCLFLCNDAYAYLDPGTGSFFLQSAIASIAAGFFVLKNYWNIFKAKFFSRKNIENVKNAEDGHDPL